MVEGGQLGRRLSFLDSRATEEAAEGGGGEEETGKNKEGRNGGLFQCTATTITSKDRHGRCSVRYSQRAQIPAAETRYCCPRLLYFPLLLSIRY